LLPTGNSKIVLAGNAELAAKQHRDNCNFAMLLKIVKSCRNLCWQKCDIYQTSEISWCLPSRVAEGWRWHSETSEICCAANKPKGTFPQCSTPDKNAARAYCMLLYACQL